MYQVPPGPGQTAKTHPEQMLLPCPNSRHRRAQLLLQKSAKNGSRLTHPFPARRAYVSEFCYGGPECSDQLPVNVDDRFGEGLWSFLR